MSKCLYTALNNALEQKLPEIYSDESNSAEKKGIKISYKLLKPGYFVLSGSGGGKVFYEKTVLVKDTVKTLRVQYPESGKNAMDPVVEKMSVCFHTALQSETTK